MLAALAAMTVGPVRAADPPPNIVYLLADDMGIGDVSALNPNSAWQTPNLDRVARAGMIFSDAHSSSAVCTPSRYSILTGRYGWRSARKEGVGAGYSPSLIEPGRLTVPLLLRQHGYVTAMFGKWHLGLDWARTGARGSKPEKDDPTDGEPAIGATREDMSDQVDYRAPFGGGPVAHGFDYFFGISASLDMPPYVWLANDHVASPPTHRIGASKLPAYWRAGIIADDFAHVDVLGRLTEKAVSFIAERARAPGQPPFFLYFAMTAPHTPIIPTPAFQGRTGTTPYGDFCVQVDDAVGRIIAALRKYGFEAGTLVVVTADNGCSPSADFAQLGRFHHDPQIGLRGAKADIYEGGHRIPFIVEWPGRVRPSSRSDQLIGQSDLLATCAEIVGAKLPADAGEDSVSLMPALLEHDKLRPLHEAIVHSSINGSFAIRQGPWKLCLCPDSGGWSYPLPGKAPAGSPPFQLFNLQTDPDERINVYSANPKIARRLGLLLKSYVANGRSTIGPPQANDGGKPWPQLDWSKQFPN